MVLLTLSASIDSLRPPRCKVRPCPQATGGQTWFLYGAPALIALGTGGIKPCVSTVGADQFDEADKKEAPKKYAFFNWFFLAINMGALFGITVFVYIQDNKGWAWGFGLPTGAMVISIVILVLGYLSNVVFPLPEMQLVLSINILQSVLFLYFKNIFEKVCFCYFLLTSN